MTKVPVTEFTDDLKSLEENTQATDVFHLDRSRKIALKQESCSYSGIKWLTAGAFSAVLAFSLILPFGSDSLAPESNIDRVVLVKSSSDETAEEIYEEDFYYWLDIYETELLVSND
ncbi:MAG: hypothetical protein P8K06_06915 [Porticoccaceae bacterium]|nr:hypothetical protein [Porticoccaceae bacterium]